MFMQKKKMLMSLMVTAMLGMAGSLPASAQTRTSINSSSNQEQAVNVKMSSTEIRQIEKSQHSITHISFKKYSHNLSLAHNSTPLQLNALLNTDDPYFIFFGFSACPYCRNFSQTLNTFMNSPKTLPVYYVDVQTFGANLDSNSPLYKKIQHFITNEVSLNSTPTIVGMKGNQIIKIYRDSSTSLKQLRELNLQLLNY